MYASLYTFLQDVRDFEKRVLYYLHGPVDWSILQVYYGKQRVDLQDKPLNTLNKQKKCP